MGFNILKTAIVSLAIGAGIGITVDQIYWPGVDALSARTDPTSELSGEPKVLYWVAPMDPNYRRDAPGKSPMGMDLIPVYEGGESELANDPSVVKVSPATENNFGVRIEPAVRRNISTEIETVGFVSYDEDKTAHVHTRASGWIEKLHVKSVGESIRKGELLIEFFSPELATAAFEYVREIQRQDARGTAGARRKLAALGVSERQIKRIGETEEVPEFIEVYAPQDGVIVKLNVAQGMFIAPDTTIMSITDLSAVWIIAEVFESQSSLVFQGMVASVTLSGYPNRTWQGAVDYIYPTVDPKTRTLQLRIPVDNTDLVMKPNMYGFVTLFGHDREDALVVNADALIRTGNSERVVVSLGDGLYKPVEVRRGLAIGDDVEILEGLTEGDEVVVSAQFLLDSESSIAAGFRRLGDQQDRDDQQIAGEEIVATGKVVHVDIGNGSITVSHEPIPALMWPEMTMDFDVMDGAQLESLADGDQIAFELIEGEGGVYAIDRIRITSEPAIRAQGVIRAFSADAHTINLTHNPIPQLNWPAMTMDFDVIKNVDLSRLQVGQEIEFELVAREDGLYEVVSVEARLAEEAGQ